MREVTTKLADAADKKGLLFLRQETQAGCAIYSPGPWYPGA